MEKDLDLAHFYFRFKMILFPKYRLAPAICLLVILSFLISGCSLFLAKRPLIKISTPPSLINTASGYLSFRLEKGEESLRGRAFFLIAAGQGRIEIFDQLGRQAFLAIWREDIELLVVPAEKVYWEGKETKTEILSQLLGLPLEPVELLAWIVGKTNGLEPLAGELKMIKAEENKVTLKIPEEKSSLAKERQGFFSGWEIEWDSQGKLWQGKKEKLRIKIIERLGTSTIARVLAFFHPQVTGRLTLLGLEFNQPISEEDFRANFVQERGFRLISWEEMEHLLRLK